MSNSKDTILSYYGNRIRVRACGIAEKNNAMLLVNHTNLTESGTFWNPPGGGVEENETVIDALKREFREECGVEIEVGKLLFINELVRLPLHGIELFFEVKVISENLSKGHDPELSEQVIREVKWLSWENIEQLKFSDKSDFLKTRNEFKKYCDGVF